MSPKREPGSWHNLRAPDSSNLQWELRAFILLSEDEGSQRPVSHPTDLRMVIRRGDIKLSDQSHQERLDLDDAIQEVSAQPPGRVSDMKGDQRTRIATRCRS